MNGMMECGGMMWGMMLFGVLGVTPSSCFLRP